jgi:hypothetical protein
VAATRAPTEPSATTASLPIDGASSATGDRPPSTPPGRSAPPTAAVTPSAAARPTPPAAAVTPPPARPNPPAAAVTPSAAARPTPPAAATTPSAAARPTPPAAAATPPSAAAPPSAGPRPTSPVSPAATPTVTRPVTPPPVARPVTPPPLAPPLTPAAAPRPKADWAAEVADRIDEVVLKVRANTSDRLVGIARMVVYGLLAAVMGATAAVLAVIFAIRLLDVAIPGDVWIPYLILGAIFLGAGLFLWSKRTAQSKA